MEYKRLLVHTLRLWKERESDLWVAQTLRSLSGANRMLGLCKEGILGAKEALRIYERLNDVPGQGWSLYYLAWSLYSDGQFSAAEEAASRAIDLLSDTGEQYRIGECHRLLGVIYHSKGEIEKAIDHFRTTLETASSFGWHGSLFWIHLSLAQLFFDQGRIGDAQACIDQAKSHTINPSYYLGHAMGLQARLWYNQQGFEEAKSEASDAVDMFEKLGVTEGSERCRALLQDIEEKTKKPVTSGELPGRCCFPRLLTLCS